MAKTQPTQQPAAEVNAIETLKAQIATLQKENADLNAQLPNPLDNPLLQHFPLENITFKNRPQRERKPWSDGTRSQSLADVIIALGDTGVIIPNVSIVMLTYTTGGRKFDLQMPSSSRAGGAVHVPFLQTADAEGAANYDEWKTLVVNHWYAEREAAVKAGAPSIATTMRNSGVNADDAMLAALGINVNAPTVPTTPGTTTAAPTAPVPPTSTT